MQEGIDVDRDCHSQLHRLHDNKHLGKNLNTLALLQADEKVAKYIAWKQKKHKYIPSSK